MADEKSEVEAEEPQDTRDFRKLIKGAYDDGHAAGVRDGLKQILTYLEDAYVNDKGRPDRGSPKAEAILEIARGAANHFRDKLK